MWTKAPPITNHATASSRSDLSCVAPRNSDSKSFHQRDKQHDSVPHLVSGEWLRHVGSTALCHQVANLQPTISRAVGCCCNGDTMGFPWTLRNRCSSALRAG